MICIPVTAGTNKEALKDIEKSCLVADFIELRMDLIEGGVLPELISAAAVRLRLKLSLPAEKGRRPPLPEKQWLSKIQKTKR